VYNQTKVHFQAESRNEKTAASPMLNLHNLVVYLGHYPVYLPGWTKGNTKLSAVEILPGYETEVLTIQHHDICSTVVNSDNDLYTDRKKLISIM
jgi:hypothetical protein